MSIDLFIPEIWSARLRRHLDRTLVYAQPMCANRNWEGEIAQAGDTVHIQRIGNPTILDYVPGVDMASPERPDGDTDALTVDQFKAFNVALDDVDAAQVNVDLLNGFTTRAGVAMAQVIDAFVANLMAAGAANNVGDTNDPVTVFADGTGDFTPYKLAVDMRRRLANENSDLEDLWLAVSPDLEAQILLDPQYIGTTRQEGDLTRTGKIGEIAGFDVLRTTGVPTAVGSAGGVAAIIGGAGNYATTFADQLTKTEAYRIEGQFGDGVKGLEVYGAKVLEGETLVVAHVGTDAEGSGS